VRKHTIAAVTALAVALALPALAGDAAPAMTPKALALGGKAPMSDTKMKNVDGKEVSISDVAGPKGTLVVFTCNACPFAKAWEQRIVALGNEYKAQGVGVIAINSNDPAVVADDSYDVMKTRATDRKMGFPYVVDDGSAVAKAFGATRTPEAFLFDGSGKLVYHGTIDDNYQEPEKVEKTYLKDALNAVVTGGSITTAETKSVGCGIKFKNKA
jgi:peroxiredoxin